MSDPFREALAAYGAAEHANVRHNIVQVTDSFNEVCALYDEAMMENVRLRNYNIQLRKDLSHCQEQL
jgi:hypothetical protein